MKAIVFDIVEVIDDVDRTREDAEYRGRSDNQNNRGGVCESLRKDKGNEHEEILWPLLHAEERSVRPTFAPVPLEMRGSMLALEHNP